MEDTQTVKATRTLVIDALKDLEFENREPLLLTLERSKYALRMVVLLRSRDSASLSWLLRRIPTSPNTVIRCASILERYGLVESRREADGRRRRFYRLTDAGERLAAQLPASWAEAPLRFRQESSRFLRR